jgi:hypothetical protein
LANGNCRCDLQMTGIATAAAHRPRQTVAMQEAASGEVFMQINEKLFVEIVPMTGDHIPHPHPISDGKFDPTYVYKVLGMYNASETSECFFILANTQREIWFIPQRHLRAVGILQSDEMFISKSRVTERHAARSDHRAPTDNWRRRDGVMGRLRPAADAR